MKMAAENGSPNNHKLERKETKCNVFISQEKPNQPVIFNPDFFVERLRHEHPQAFTELVLSNITRMIDLPGDEFAQLTGDSEPRVPSSSGFLRSFNFLKRKDKGVVFGAPLTEEGIAQIYQLIEYLNKNLHVEGLFRVPGHSLRQAALREMLNTGAEIDLETGDFHPNDAATLLKAYLGELPEPLLTHRHYHAHLKIGELTRFDDQGDKTNVPDKERQIEAFQLLFMLLPSANRSLLKLLFDLLHSTARNQHSNKMSAINLAKMFAPHIIWPKNVMASDLQGDIEKLNNGIAFLIRHSQKLFKAPAYIKEYARLYFTGSKALQSNDDLTLCSGAKEGPMTAVTVASPSPSITTVTSDTQNYTESALRELYQQVSSMPESAKKKKLIRQIEKQTPSAESRAPFSRRHWRSRSWGGIIKKKVFGSQMLAEKENGRPQTHLPSCSADGQD
ncbi:rho GTPase-activating protein 19 [Maylandia zebra]|uniref:Rho GTPase-activating protein 19 n=3 Tax=Haplochromini TaxID=319058 RepID=A0A3B4FQI5_9CICH|nr:rho GTPase-activating protein 19 [Maylandia zebra]XP_005743908.1 PREDICTED: rho GTPase-activating protein 19-like [Pundamilia nyererei]XP_005913942.1 rho GTPase-activating protein 19 [Haplochromis burtoni]